MYKQEDFSHNSDNTMETYSFNISESEEYDISTLMPTLHDGTLVPGNFLVLSPPLLQEETMDVATKFQTEEFCPVAKRGPPERTVFAGDLDFQVEINAIDTHKKKYLYSSQLNRIYVDMGCNFPVQFRWEWGRAPRPVLVRAAVVFSDESQAEKRVERCTQHTHETKNAELGLNIVKNVLHSAREMGTHGVYYCGSPDAADSWYSVVVEMPATGPTTHAYQFVCKNSCSTGINRRAIDIIYTLEDSTGHVYGRQIVGARVCACPRRDMVRDEKEGAARMRKRRMQQAKPDVGNNKKVKHEPAPGTDDAHVTDDVPIPLPQLEVIGARTLLTGLEVMASMMEQAMALKKSDQQQVDKYTENIAAIRSWMEAYRSNL